MKTHSIRSVVSVMSALCLTGLACLAQSPAPAVSSASTPMPVPEPTLPFQQIGKVTARSAHEIASSDWSVGCETLDRDMADFSKYRDHLGPLGAKGARLQAGWAKTEKVPGTYDWKWLDEIVDGVVSQGVTPWICISYGNPAYPSGGGKGLGDGLPKSPEAIAAWHAWSKALVLRYKDRVGAWEIWNEPDIGKQVKADDYTELFITTAEMIRAEAPRAKIYALGLAGHLDYFETFLTILQSRGKLGLFDYVTIHGYPDNPDDLSSYTKPKAIADKFPEAHIKFRQGETGCPSSRSVGALSNRDWTELGQAKWNLRRELAHHGNGIPMSQFTIADLEYKKSFMDGFNTKGLLSLNPDRTVSHRKMAYCGAQHVFSIFDDSVVLEPGVTVEHNAPEKTAVYAYNKKGTGASLVTVWLSGKPVTDGIDMKPVDFSFKGVQFTNPVYVDLRTGGVYEIPASAWSKEGGVVKFHGIPVYDSPVMIADKSTFLFK